MQFIEPNQGPPPPPTHSNCVSVLTKKHSPRKCTLHRKHVTSAQKLLVLWQQSLGCWRWASLLLRTEPVASQEYESYPVVSWTGNDIVNIAEQWFTITPALKPSPLNTWPSSGGGGFGGRGTYFHYLYISVCFKLLIKQHSQSIYQILTLFHYSFQHGDWQNNKAAT